MSERASWFRCDQSRLLGALAGMEPDSGYLYTVILLRIYEVGGPISDDERVLARRTGMSPRRVGAALAWLVGHGKVERLPTGAIDSETTHAELAFREKALIDARNAGKESAKRKQKFGNRKDQQKQQNGPTPVERPSNGSATDEQRPSTESEVREELSSDSSFCAPAPSPKNDARGMRLPAGWTPDADGMALAVAELGEFRAKRELDKFRDYWPAQPGVKSRRTDWPMTWRNWVRKAADDSRARAGPNGSPPFKTNPRLQAIEESQADADRGYTVTIPGL